MFVAPLCTLLPFTLKLYVSKPAVAVKVTFAPVQILLSLLAVPDVSAAVNVPLGNGLTVITAEPKVEVQLFELVTSTVTDAPLVSAVLL